MWWFNFSMTQYDSIVIKNFHEENTSIFQWLYVCHSFVPMKLDPGSWKPLLFVRALLRRKERPLGPTVPSPIAMTHSPIEAMCFEDVLNQTCCDPTWSNPFQLISQVHSFTTQLMESIWWRRSRPRSLHFWGKFWKGQLLISLKFFGELSELLSFIWVDHGHLMSIWWHLIFVFFRLLRYYDHIKNNPETLVVRFLGLHCLRVQKRVSRFRRSVQNGDQLKRWLGCLKKRVPINRSHWSSSWCFAIHENVGGHIDQFSDIFQRKTSGFGLAEGHWSKRISFLL